MSHDLAIPSVEWLYPISLGTDPLYLGCAQCGNLVNSQLPTACRYTHALRTYCYCSVILLHSQMPTACRDSRRGTLKSRSLHGSDILVQQELGRPALVRFVSYCSFKRELSLDCTGIPPGDPRKNAHKAGLIPTYAPNQQSWLLLAERE